RVSAHLPELVAAFVDPYELHFRTFENIVPLDRLLTAAPMQLTLDERKRLGSKHQQIYTFTVKADPESARALLHLDALELYVAPLNAQVRGGKRLIFHSAHLARALTEAVREVWPARLSKGFVHVNPVFRLNRFEPGDAPFGYHHDTPYYD